MKSNGCSQKKMEKVLGRVYDVNLDQRNTCAYGGSKTLGPNLFPLVSTLEQKPLRGEEWEAIRIPAFKILIKIHDR